MKTLWKVAGWAALLGVVGGILVTVRRVYIKKRPHSTKSITLRGAVIRQDADPNKQLPIADVEISAIDGLAASDSKSDSSGLFRLALRPDIPMRQSVTLIFRHPAYKPLELHGTAGDQLFVARMAPIPQQTRPASDRPDVVIANVSVRYSIKATAVVNVGSAVKTFEVVNKGNVPCNGQSPCSPDRKWKAGRGSATLDAGEGNEFRNARVSCIAGPCPFTKIESSNFSQQSRTISVSALGWSDTTTFLLEAEVVRSTVSDVLRESYPVIFGEALNFTLPAGAEGVSIEADLDGVQIVFPLGPSLFLSWSECTSRVNSDQSKVYRCELKPGYRFR